MALGKPRAFFRPIEKGGLMEKDEILQAMKELWVEVLGDEAETRFNIRGGLLRLAAKLNLAREFGEEIAPGW